MELLFHGVGLYLEEMNFGPVCWPHQDLFVVRDGEVLFQTATGNLRLVKGDAIWIPSGVRFHGMAEAERNTLWVCHFRSRTLRIGTHALELAAGVGVFRGGGHSDLANALMDRLHQIYQGNSQWPEFAEKYFEALVIEVGRNARAHSNSEEQWLLGLEIWAREHLDERLGVRELALQAGLSESHFRRLFLQRRGISPGKFLNTLRLSEAKLLLQQPSLSLKEIGARVGYADTVAFHHAFSRTFRMTPTHFRKGISSAI